MIVNFSGVLFRSIYKIEILQIFAYITCTEINGFLNIVKLGHIWIVITLFRLIFPQMEFRLVQNQSEKYDSAPFKQPLAHALLPSEVTLSFLPKDVECSETYSVCFFSVWKKNVFFIFLLDNKVFNSSFWELRFYMKKILSKKTRMKIPCLSLFFQYRLKHTWVKKIKLPISSKKKGLLYDTQKKLLHTIYW